MNITVLDKEFIILEHKLKLQSQDINLLLQDYKNFIHFFKLIKVFEKNKWNELTIRYKEVKSQGTKNINSYKNIIALYQELYMYYDVNLMPIKEKKINELKNMIDDNVFNLLNLQKQHKEYYYKKKNLLKLQQTIVVLTIPPNLLLQYHDIVCLYGEMNKISCIVRQNKYRLLALNNLNSHTLSTPEQKDQYTELHPPTWVANNAE